MTKRTDSHIIDELCLARDDAPSSSGSSDDYIMSSITNSEKQKTVIEHDRRNLRRKFQNQGVPSTTLNKEKDDEQREQLFQQHYSHIQTLNSTSAEIEHDRRNLKQKFQKTGMIPQDLEANHTESSLQASLNAYHAQYHNNEKIINARSKKLLQKQRKHPSSSSSNFSSSTANFGTTQHQRWINHQNKVQGNMLLHQQLPQPATWNDQSDFNGMPSQRSTEDLRLMQQQLLPPSDQQSFVHSSSSMGGMNTELQTLTKKRREGVHSKALKFMLILVGIATMMGFAYYLETSFQVQSYVERLQECARDYIKLRRTVAMDLIATKSGENRRAERILSDALSIDRKSVV